MRTSKTVAFPTALSKPEPSPRHRFTIRADGGFLSACDGIGGPPVALVPNPAEAVHFVDPDTAVIRARLMLEVGWTNLRVVEILLPSLLTPSSTHS
jgi:hypothetical protein